MFGFIEVLIALAISAMLCVSGLQSSRNSTSMLEATQRQVIAMEQLWARFQKVTSPLLQSLPGQSFQQSQLTWYEQSLHQYKKVSLP